MHARAGPRGASSWAGRFGYTAALWEVRRGKGDWGWEWAEGMGEGYRGRLACAGAGSVHGSGNVRVCRHGEGRGTKGSDIEGSDIEGIDDDQNADERCFGL